MTPHSNNVLARAARAWCKNSLVFVASGLAAGWLLWAGIAWHSTIKHRDRQTAERMWKAISGAPFDATHSKPPVYLSNAVVHLNNSDWIARADDHTNDWQRYSEAVFDATHVFQLRGSQPGYATLTLHAKGQQSYQYGYALTNLTLTVNAIGIGVEHVGSNYIITFKP